jgi:hypothetical protein
MKRCAFRQKVGDERIMLHVRPNKFIDHGCVVDERFTDEKQQQHGSFCRIQLFCRNNMVYRRL